MTDTTPTDDVGPDITEELYRWRRYAVARRDADAAAARLRRHEDEPVIRDLAWSETRLHLFERAELTEQVAVEEHRAALRVTDTEIEALYDGDEPAPRGGPLAPLRA